MDEGSHVCITTICCDYICTYVGIYYVICQHLWGSINWLLSIKKIGNDFAVHYVNIDAAHSYTHICIYNSMLAYKIKLKA